MSHMWTKQLVKMCKVDWFWGHIYQYTPRRYAPEGQWDRPQQRGASHCPPSLEALLHGYFHRRNFVCDFWKVVVTVTITFSTCNMKLSSLTEQVLWLSVSVSCIMYSKRRKFRPKMRQNAFGGRAPPGPVISVRFFVKNCATSVPPRSRSNSTAACSRLSPYTQKNNVYVLVLHF